MRRLLAFWLAASSLAIGSVSPAAPSPRSAPQAAAELVEALRDAPDDVDLWLKLARARSAMSEPDEAIAAYRRVLEIEPGHAVAAHNLGNVLFRRGEMAEAAAMYARALENDPGYMLAAFHLGWTLRQLNRAAEAETAFEQCLALPATDDRARSTRVDCAFGLGSLRHRAGDYTASATLMEQVLSVHPRHLEARYLLGMAYRQLGRLDDAQRMLESHRAMLRAKREATGGMPPGE